MNLPTTHAAALCAVLLSAAAATAQTSTPVQVNVPGAACVRTPTYDQLHDPSLVVPAAEALAAQYTLEGNGLHIYRDRNVGFTPMRSAIACPVPKPSPYGKTVVHVHLSTTFEPQVQPESTACSLVIKDTHGEMIGRLDRQSLPVFGTQTLVLEPTGQLATAMGVASLTCKLTNQQLVRLHGITVWGSQ